MSWVELTDDDFDADDDDNTDEDGDIDDESSLKRRMRYFAVISLYCRFASSRVALGTQSSMLR